MAKRQSEVVPHDKDKDNPSELIRGRDVAVSGLWSLPSLDGPRDESAATAPQMPAVAGPALALPAMGEVELGTIKPPALEGIEVVHQDACNENFAAGERDGFHIGQLKARQEAEKVLEECLQSLEHLMTQLLEPIAGQDALIEQGMVNLASHVARQVIQRELYTDFSHAHQVPHEALKLLSMDAVSIRIYVNPQGFEWVKALRERHEGSWRTLEDDSLLPGGYRIGTEHSRINTAIETCLTQAVKQLSEQQCGQATHPLTSDTWTSLDAPGDIGAP